jgi:branched-chain amino acid transport system substrate-binding protein
MLCAAASGCSSSANKAASGTSTITVGDIGQYSGVLASTFGAIPKVLDAWVSMVNASGGLGGHQVRLIHKDVGDTTGAGLRAIKELIDQEHVVAVISDLDNSDRTWLPYAQQKGVPIIPTQASAGSISNPIAFPTLDSPIAFGYAQANLAKTAGSKLGAVYCAEAAGCEQNNALIKQFADRISLEQPAALKVSSSLPDYTSVCQQFKDAKVDLYEVVMSSAVGVKIADTCYSQGLRAPQLLRGPAAVPEWKTDKAFAGGVVADAVAPYFDTTTPGVKIYRDALQKYAPSVVGTNLDNSSDLYAWSGAQLFAAAVARSTDKVTGANVIKGLYALKDETLGGIVGPLNFASGQVTFNNCYFAWKIAPGGEFVGMNSNKPVCAPTDLIGPIQASYLKSLGK